MPASSDGAGVASPHPLERLVPGPPAWAVDWKGWRDAIDCLRDLDGCAQDPLYHAEGDVGTHTRLVCEALAEDGAYRALAPQQRLIVFLAALLHDAGKPATTATEEQGRVTSRGHSRIGERLARVTLWRHGVNPQVREQVAALVRHHQAPLHGLDLRDLRRTVLGMSVRLRCHHLTLVARADARGRRCRDPVDVTRMTDNIELFAEYCREQDCAEQPHAFASDHTRFLYFRERWADPDVTAYDDTRATVTVMSGLPGVGKDTWIGRHASAQPVVSLDAIREAEGVRPTDPQGGVVAAAREAARVYLRAGTDFVWNATNVSRRLRGGLVDFLWRYRARVRFVAVEGAAVALAARRSAGRGVPEPVLERLVAQWSVPDLTEAHEVQWETGRD